MSDLIKVRFTRRHERYNENEVAGFIASKARELVFGVGAAELVEGEVLPMSPEEGGDMGLTNSGGAPVVKPIEPDKAPAPTPAPSVLLGVKKG